MDEMDENKKSQAAKEKPRGVHGRFAHSQNPEESVGKENPSHPLTDFLHQQTSVSGKHDDKTLIDVHVSNPLRKITELLEEIKKQKAFSFTLKGSLGVAGIVLVAGTFGLLGGSKALCSKGVQSTIGTFQVLTIAEEPQNTALVEKMGKAWDLLLDKPPTSRLQQRVILVKPDQEAFRIIGITKPLFPFVNSQQQVIVTGEMDSCSNTITITDPQGVQFY